jgi:hypothetical protein
VLFQEEQDAPLIRKLPSERIRALIARQRELSYGDVPSEPPHGFLGRSRELLAAERILCYTASETASEKASGTGPLACQP